MIDLKIPRPHPAQEALVRSDAKRIMAVCGRRSGKTTAVAIRAVEEMALKSARVLYVSPTSAQTDVFYDAIIEILTPLIDADLCLTNHTRRLIRDINGGRIRAVSGYNPDALRGDHADLLIFDEWQIQRETLWSEVGLPMLVDTDGVAVFILTPPSLSSSAISRSIDPLHAARHWETAQQSASYDCIHFPTMANPYISAEAVEQMRNEMTDLAYRQEILAEMLDEAPNALWRRRDIRHAPAPSEAERIVVGVDPSGSRDGDECGIVIAGLFNGAGYVIEDATVRGASPEEWARVVVNAYHRYKADRIVAEKNFGGDMVESTIRVVDPDVSLRLVTASRGKDIRAEPVAALYERGRVFHAEPFPRLEQQMTQWVPGSGMTSPDRMDALVWSLTELMLDAPLIVSGRVIE